MATSLAEQLKRLAVPQTSHLIRDDKKRASLLFEPKEAAGLKRETIYQIGLDGLEELIEKNEIFTQYKNNLFHITSKTFERGVQSAEDNQRLNRVIKKFILHLSPYFLLNCASKALEWLINRFNIHEYNREELLMLILPYHESNLFVRVVQLMKFKDSNDSWYFLKSLQKQGVHLTKHNLLKKASSDIYFVKFIGKFITSLIKVHEKHNILTVAFNFFCTVYCGAIEYSHPISEAQITQILPIVLKGLQSDIADFCAASYVIVARLVAKVTLEKAILDKFIEKIAIIPVENLKTEACLTLVIICQTQEHYSKISEEACLKLAEKEYLAKIFQDFNNSGCLIWPFLKALFHGCLPLALNGTTTRDFVHVLLTNIKFDDDFVGVFLDVFFDIIKETKPLPKDFSTAIMETIEKQYPDQFDREVYKIFSTTTYDLRKKRILQRLIKNAMTLRGKFNVFHKLYHPNAQIRSEALKYLRENFNELRDGEKEMIKGSFIDRLNDDDVDVVKEALILIKSTELLDRVVVKANLIRLIKKVAVDWLTWQPIAVEAVILLCEQSEVNDWEVFLALFPFLLPFEEEQLKLASLIVNSEFIRKSGILKWGKRPRWNCVEEFRRCCLEGLHGTDLNGLCEFVRVLKRNITKDVFDKYLATLILSHIVPEDCPIDIGAGIVEVFTVYFTHSEHDAISYKKTNFEGNFKMACQGKFPMQFYLEAMGRVVLKMQKPTDIQWALIDFSQDNSFNKFFHLTCNALMGTHSKLATDFLENFCPQSGKVDFLLNLALVNDSKLNLIDALLKMDLTHFDRRQIPYILTLLLDESQDVRMKVCCMMEMGQDPVLGAILHQKEAIILDAEQVPLIIFNVITSKWQNGDLQEILIEAACNKENPIYLRSKVLRLLSHINSVEIFERTAKIALDILEKGEDLNEMESMVIVENLSRIDGNIAKFIRFNTNIWRFMEIVLCQDEIRVFPQPKQTTNPIILLLNNLNRDFFQQLPDIIEGKVLNLLIKTATATQNPQVLPAISQIFKHIDLDARQIAGLLVKMRDVQSPKLDVNKLKRRISVVPTIDILDTEEWRHGVTLLEFLQDKKKIRHIEVIIPLLFDVLKKCLEFDEQASLEYPKQLILSGILHFSNRLSTENLPVKCFNIESIVQCIRASQNPQTHHHALLVLAHSANLVPDQVLHHVMAIFTFMGSSLLRHDDAYSYQVITKIIDTIIPILISDSSVDNVARVFRVFVDVVLDVPEHRRLRLYKQLLEKIGVEESLYIFLLLIFEAVIISKPAGDSSKRINFTTNLCCEFPPNIAIKACISLMEFLKKLPDVMEEQELKVMFDITFKTAKQLRHFKYITVTFISGLLASKEFVVKVAELTDDSTGQLEQLYKDSIIEILTYIQRISKIVNGKNETQPQNNYWKIMLHHSYDVLDSVNTLLTPSMFLLVVRGLMVHNLPTVRRRALELLNGKLAQSGFFEECDDEELLALIPPLVKIIQSINQNAESEEEIIVQTALLSLKLLVKLQAKTNPERFIEVLDFINDVIKSNRAQRNVLASVVLCLAELCCNLRTNAIESLPDFMPVLLKILRQEKHQDHPTLLLLSCTTAIQKLLMVLPLFLSPYLEKLLCELSILTVRWQDEQQQQQKVLGEKLLSVREKIGEVIPARVLIPAIGQSYERLIKKQAFNALAPLMDVLGENLNGLKQTDLKGNLQELTNFFLNALEFRELHSIYHNVDVVESGIIQALTKLILKLSESSFRPLYYKIFDWAVRCERRSERSITFYSLSSGIAECLKGLFVLFAGHFVNNAAQVLDLCNNTKDELYFSNDDGKNVLLLEYVLKTLWAVFRYDNHKFLNKDRFDVLMQPLVDQLENQLPYDDELLTKCLAEFAVAVGDDALWKQLNYQVLLKMRDTAPEVRLRALKSLTEIVRKLGEDFLPLLPETIPFLAELLEDEEENVEKCTKKAVQEMEKILGEPLQKYF